MSQTIDLIRLKYPQYKNLSDEDLTIAVGKKYPMYFKSDPQFANDFNNVAFGGKVSSQASSIPGLGVVPSVSSSELQRERRASNIEQGGLPTQIGSALGEMLAKSGQEIGFAQGRAMGVQGLPQQPNPTTYPQALHQGAVNVAGQFLNPEMAPFALLTPLESLKFLPYAPLLVRGGLAAMTTPGVAQGLGAATAPQQTGPQRLQALTETAGGTLGYLPLGEYGYRKLLPEIRENIALDKNTTEKPKVPIRTGPLPPNTANQGLGAQFRSRGPIQASTPVEPVKTEPTPLSKPPTTTLSPAQIVAEHKQKLQAMTPDQLRQLITESKAKTIQDPIVAYQEAVMNQQFPREELQKRGEQLQAPLDMGQVAHSYQRPATQVQLAMQDAVKNGAITKEQQIQWNRQIFNAHQDLVQKANSGTMTGQDRDNALNLLKQINTEVQNASRKSSTTGVPEHEVRARVGKEAPLRQQGQVAEARQGQQAQGPLQEAPQGTVSTGVGQLPRPASGHDVEGHGRVEEIAQKVANPKTGKLNQQELDILGKLDPQARQSYLARVKQLRSVEKVDKTRQSEAGSIFPDIYGRRWDTNPGWMDRSGNLQQFNANKFSHGDIARNKTKNPNETTESYQQKGNLRVTFIPDEHSMYFEGKPLDKQWSKLKELAIERSLKIVDANDRILFDGRSKTSSESGSIFPESPGARKFKEAGAKEEPDNIVHQALSKLNSLSATGSDIRRAVMNSAFVNRRRGYDLPAMESASPKLANAAAEYGNAAVTGRMEADSAVRELTQNLPQDKPFWDKVGAVFYEDMRQAAGKPGKSVWDFPNSPIKSEQDFKAALANKQVQQAIERWKEVIQKPATEMHVQLGGSLLDVGEETGAFANLKALREEGEPEHTGTTPRTGPLASMKGRTSFGFQRKYSGQNYVWDARELGYRMLTKNYTKVQLDNFYKALEESGQGKLVKNKSEAPEGMTVLENPVRLRTIITKEGQSVQQNQWLAVNPKVLSETKQLLQVNTSFGKMLKEGVPALNLLNNLALRVQVGLGIDLGFHTANDFAATLQAYKYNMPRAAVQTTKATIDYIRNDPAVQKELLNMAHSGVTFRGQNVAGWGSKSLKFVDTVTRLVLNREFDRQVAAKRFVDSPAERRRYINSRAGQYNKRFMTYLQQSAQESALGAFNVAGRNFNRLAVRAVLGSPGAKAPTTSQAILNRLSVATGLALFAIVAPSVYNEAKWGQAQPQGTRVGELAYSKNPDGTYNVADLFKLSLVGRAGRVTGINPILKEQVLPRLAGEQTPPLSSTLSHAGMTAAATAMQPFWGPPLAVASSLATGKTMPGIGFNEKTPGETGPPFYRAALSSVNPIAGPIAAAPDVSSFEMGQAGKGVWQRLKSIAGGKQTSGPVSQVATWANYYKQRNNIKADTGDFSPSEYGPLRAALAAGDVDKAKQAYQQLLHEKSQRGNLSDEEAKDHAMKDMQKYFSHLANYNFVNKEDEAKFMAGLTPKQREVYANAQQELKQVANLFFSQVQPKTEGKPRGFHAPSIRSFRHF